MEFITLLYAVLPFVTAIVFKIFGFQKGGEAQKSALKRMIKERKTPSGALLLDDDQIEMVVSATSFAVRSITAASTLIASLIALLIVALKYSHPFTWWCFGVDVVLAIVVWIKVHKHAGTWEDIAYVSPGEFFLLMSFVVDAIGLAASISGPWLVGTK